MKTLKENSSKMPKDVLLNQIFQELAEEDKEINGDNYLLDEIIPVPNTKLSRIREIQKKRQWFFIVFLMLSIVYLWFSTGTDTEVVPIEVKKTKHDSYVFPKEHIADKPKEIVKHPDVKVKTNPIFVMEKNSIHVKKVKIQTVMKPKEPQTTREKAKEALFKQMQN